MKRIPMSLKIRQGHLGSFIGTELQFESAKCIDKVRLSPETYSDGSFRHDLNDV